MSEEAVLIKEPEEVLLTEDGLPVRGKGLPRWRIFFASIVAVLFSLFHIWNTYTGLFSGQQLTSVHLTGVLMMGILLRSAWQSRWTRMETTLSLLLVGLSAGSGLYLFMVYLTYPLRAGIPNTFDIIWGIVLIFLVLELARRFVGNALTILAIISLFYLFFGHKLPVILTHRIFSLSEIVENMYLGSEGIHGLALQVSASYIVMFVIFGAFLSVSGAGQFFINLALVLFGRVRGGPGKVAVFASSLFGTISGSAVANVMVDGWLTIPLMKRTGFKPEFAAAVEATASTGGQIMPPVMGSAAFIMAELIGMPYAKIAIAAIVPALLYYFGLFIMIDFEATKRGWDKKKAEEAIAAAKPTLNPLSFLHFIPILVLVYFLFFKSFTPYLSALYAGLVALAVGYVFPENRGIRKIFTALREGGEGTIEVAAACAAAGIIMGALVQSGLGVRLSGLLVELSGGSIHVMLVLAMVASLILGMGLPTVPCYIITAITIAPALIKMGVQVLPAHLFVFYFGCISMLTPPVALAAYAAAGIGRADPFKTGWTATRLAASGFIIPFMFAMGPSLILIGSLPAIVQSVSTAIVGVIGLSVAIIGRCFFPVNWWERTVLFISALLLMYVGTIMDIIGLFGCLLIAIRQFRLWKRYSINNTQ